MSAYRFLLASFLLCYWVGTVEGQQNADAAPQKSLDAPHIATSSQSTESQENADSQSDEDRELCREQCGGIKQLHRLGGIYLAGQPSADDLKKARDRGIKSVVNLRQPDEIDWDEEKAAQQLGLQYHSIPFRSPESLTDSVFDKARMVLSDREKRPLMLHCGTANRVGAVWLVYRVLDDGVPVAQALDEAKTVGLRTPAYVDKAKDYVHRHQSD